MCFSYWLCLAILVLLYSFVPTYKLEYLLKESVNLNINCAAVTSREYKQKYFFIRSTAWGAWFTAKLYGPLTTKLACMKTVKLIVCVCTMKVIGSVTATVPRDPVCTFTYMYLTCSISGAS